MNDQRPLDEVHTEDEIREARDAVGHINQLGLNFEQLCVDRHDYGQDKYGKFTFLENDIIGAMLEELADTVNYCRYQAVKLMMLQEALEGHLAENPLTETQAGDITIGAKAFKGVGEVGWQK